VGSAEITLHHYLTVPVRSEMDRHTASLVAEYDHELGVYRAPPDPSARGCWAEDVADVVGGAVLGIECSASAYEFLKFGA
jgi:hypothetical protein